MATITKEDIEKARLVSIIDYVERTGMGNLTKSGKYYRLHYAGHDSIVIDSEKNRFYHNSTNEKGDIIHFLVYFKGIKFSEAVTELSDGDYKSLPSNERDADKPRETFKLPEYLTAKRNNIDEYLIDQRAISKETVDYFYRKGMIKQDKIGQVYFLWKPSGSINYGVIGGSKVNPKNHFKGILKNSAENFGFNILIGESPKSHFYFESAIDLISFYDLNKERIDNARLCSLEGVKVQTMYNFITSSFKYYKVKPSDIYIATDNDKAGIIFWQEMNDHPMEYQDGQRLDYINLIPNYSYYDKELLEIYHQASKEYNVDWKVLASVHKHETNCSLNTEITNSKEFSKYFGHTEALEDLTYDEIKLKVDILANEINNLGLSFYDFVDEMTEENENTRKDIAIIYSDLNKNKYISVNAKEICKDWNDVSKSANQQMIVKEERVLKDEHQLYG